MSKLGFIKRHYKAFLLFSMTCLVCLSLGFNMIIPFFDKRFNQAEIKEQVKEESSALGTQLNVDSISTDAYIISTNDSYVEAGSSGIGIITNTTRLLVGQQNQTIYVNQTTQGSAQTVRLGAVIRTGQTIVNFPQGIITQVDLMLYKAGTPTGTASVTVRNMNGDALLGTIGTIDVSTLTTTATWKTFATTPIKIDKTMNVRIQIEYASGTSANYLRVRYQNGAATTFGFRDTYTGTTYTNSTGTDCAFRIKYYNVNVSRGMLFFDTSSIPDNAFIDNATLRLYASNDYSTTDFYLLLKNGMNTYPHRPLIVSDFKKSNYIGIGGNKTTSGLAINYNNIPLNAVGLNWINKTSFTKLCVMSSRDANGNSPTGNEYVSFYSSEQGANYKPQLIVNYTVPTWDENDWFYESQSSGYGGMQKIKVNHTRAWHDLKQHAKWILQWYDGYSWIDSSNFVNNHLVSLLDNYTQKFALQFTPPYAGDYRLQLTIDYVLDSYNYDDASKTYSLLYHDFEGTNLTFTFGYSDISQLPGLGFSNYINPQGQFIFNITRTVSANEVNTLISLDPTYGIMPAAVTDSYEWDKVNGQAPNMVRLGTSQYYLILSRATSTGTVGIWANTTKVWNDNGTIQKSCIDTLRIGAGYYPNVINVYGDIYVVAYENTVPRIATFSADDADGSIPAAITDSLALSTYNCYYSDIVRVSNNVFVIAWTNQSYTGGRLTSVYIDNNGNIPATVNDTVIFNSTTANYPRVKSVDSNTVAITYSGNGDDGYLVTYDVNPTTGDITNTWDDQWEFDTTYGGQTYIKKISGNVYAIAYRDSASDIQVKTLTISTAGSITKSWIDTLVMGAETATFSTLFVVNNLSVYGVTYQGTDGDGWVKTFNITSAGQMGAAIIDSLEFDIADCIKWGSIAWVNKSWYFIVYEGTGNDGWSCTVSIDTNYASPTFANPSPANNSVDQALTPQCAITVNDLNGDAMTVNFYENSTGSWLLRQTNSSCANGTYRWNFAQASSYSLKYYWKVYINDGTHNVSNWYCFTTEAPPAQSTWQIIDQSINGSIYNNTGSWQTISTTINGSIYNNTGVWDIIDQSINGSIYNLTGSWQTISTTINGSIYNSSASSWNIISQSINGSVYNASSNAWQIVSQSINGSIYNSTGIWQTISTSINGSVYNISTSSWNVISSDINGSVYNSSISSWNIINSAINGSIYNLSGTWSIISNTINGSVYNASTYTWQTISTSINGSIYNVSILSWTIISTSINGSIYNASSPIEPATPYNLNLLVINPNPGNGTHNTNYLKSNASGLTTSIDIYYENFTTPAALMPGDYSMVINSTLFTNTPTTWNTSAVYALVWNNATGGIASSAPLYVGQLNAAGDYTTFRSFLQFNTSSLPDSAIITSAYIKLVVWQDFSTSDFNVTLLSVKPPKPHNPLIPSDYSRSGIGTVSLGHTNTTGYINDDIFNIVLNAAGINYIYTETPANFSVRSHKDLNQTAPIVDGNEWITFYGNGMPIANYPKLILNYTIPNSNWEHFVNLTWYSNSSGAWTKYYESYINSNGTTTVPALNFSGIDTYFWHLEWESNHTNNGSSQVFTFTTVAAGGGGSSMNTRDRFTLGLVIGSMVFMMLGFVLFRKKKRKI